MRQNIVRVLKGRFLVSEDSVKNWKLIVFIAVLALFMIASSHYAEQKVYRIANLDKEVKELRSEYVDVRTRLMDLKLESNVRKVMEVRGLEASEVPPKKIIIK